MSEWARVRALKADGVSEREIARRLGMNRRTVARLVAAEMPPRYRREPAGSMLDPLEPVLARLVAEHETIKAPRVTEILREDYGYTGSVDLVRKRLALLRPRRERPAQRTGYAPAQVMQVDWAEMPTRPKTLGRERRVYALICSLPFSGASTAHFSFDMTGVVFGGPRSRVRMAGRRAQGVCLRQPARGGRASRRPAGHLGAEVQPVARPLRLPRARVHAGDAAREGRRRGRRSLSQDCAGAGVVAGDDE